MRGDNEICNLFSYIDLEKRVRADHPLRVIREIPNAALAALTGEFAELYSPIGRGSVPPERLMRPLLLQAFYSIRLGAAVGRLVERIDYDLLFRWFVGLGIEDPVWEPRHPRRTATGCSRARWRRSSLPRCWCKQSEAPVVERAFFGQRHAVGGAATMKSLHPKDGSGNPAGSGRYRERDSRGERRKTTPHLSTTDPDARLSCRGAGEEARVVFMGHALMENRDGLVVSAVATRASGHAERLAALALIQACAERLGVALGADKGYDTADFVMELREQGVTPHVAQNQSGRRSAIDGCTTRHSGYAISQCLRKRIEEVLARPRR